MWNGMKSVVQFNPLESREQRLSKFDGWMKDTGRVSSVADKAVPTAEETREYLRRRLRATDRV